MPTTTKFNAKIVEVKNKLIINNGLDVSGNVIFNGDKIDVNSKINSEHIYPINTETYTLGSENKRWKNIFSKNLNLFNNLTVEGNSNLNGNLNSKIIYPIDNEIYTLGSENKRWKNIFSKKAKVDNFISEKIIPMDDSNGNIGIPLKKWKNIYATNLLISSSDRRQKNNIEECDLGLDFIKSLEPVKFKFINGDRIHYGLISQDVRDQLKNQGKTFYGENNNKTDDFGGYCYDLHDNIENLPNDDIFWLRYGEFISPMIKAIQELSEKVAEQQTTIDLLLAREN